jgi:hypothetical protein
MSAKIYRPARTAMQSGQASTHDWVLVFEDTDSRFKDPLMGWTGSTDMNQEVKLKFHTKEEAIRFAEEHNMVYEVIEPQERKVKPKSYADNFKKVV